MLEKIVKEEIAKYQQTIDKYESELKLYNNSPCQRSVALATKISTIKSVIRDLKLMLE